MPARLARSTLAFLTVVALAGCGARVTGAEPESTGAGHYPVTVDNCGVRTTFDRAPRRVVTNDVGIAEIMFALGLEKHMAGYVAPDYKSRRGKLPWQDGYRKVRLLSRKQINKEMVLDAKADLVFAGWNYGFGEGEGFTPEGLRKLGIGSYVLTESCHSGPGGRRGVMPPLEALYTDLTNLGKIFDVEDRARALVAGFRKQVADARATVPAGKRPKVFLYDSGQDQPVTAGRFAGPQDIITKAGGENVMGDLQDTWTTVGWETVVRRGPEVIVINDYGDVSAEKKRDFLLSYPPLADVPAIRDKRVFVLDYADLVESPRNPAAVADLARYLRQARPA
ncbi:ABC transporter substrate-binding protein [Streptomyces orinoci]|uniref:ABC transporter substrate-binding protein n=1 Tax=Streptomyces orinoci TaxID=67339 RepID=A0ABV3JTN0_STRON|nr:ABC transporter substrate-binding protein [Streptomyces orinoci]